MLGRHLAAVGVLLAAASAPAQPAAPYSTTVLGVTIKFADPPEAPPPQQQEGGLPHEALYPPQRAGAQGIVGSVSFAKLVAKQISGVRVTWSDTKHFYSHVEADDLLREILGNAKTQAYRFHVWSNVDGSPCLTATVAHRSGSQGRLVVWCEDPVAADPPSRPNASAGSVKWAYEDGSGRWWWAGLVPKFSLPPGTKISGSITPYFPQAAPDTTAALFAALKDHDTGALKSLLAKGASPSLQDSSGHAALGIAAQNGDLDAVKVLLAAGAGINDVDHFGPPIWYAVTFNQLDTVKFLLAHGAEVDVRNRMNQTSLIWAVRSDRTEMAELLISHGADINAVDRTKVGLLTVASLANDQDIVRLLEKAGAHYASAQEEMMAAASFGDAVHIRELIAAGTPVDFAGSNYASAAAGETPLMAASEKGQTVAVRTLLAAGASVAAIDREHRTALFYAIVSAHRSTIDALLAAGADPKAKMGGSSTTLMELANRMDDPDLARQFIAAGVDPNATTDNSSVFTALNQAATMNHPQVLKVLLGAGADVNFRTTLEGETALIDAARSGATECVQILLRAGADPTIRDYRPNSGKTAREWAIEFNHPEIAAMLPAN